MENLTRSTRVTGERKDRCRFAVVPFITRLSVVSVAVAAVLSASMSTEAQSQLSYKLVSLDSGASPAAAKIGDLDGDGLNDIAVVNTQGSLQLFFNKGAGSFERISLNGLWPSGAKTLDLDIGDLNRDGRNDLAAAFSTPTGAISVLFNQGNRQFSSPVNYDSCGNSNGVAIGDLNLDGNNDLADIGQCSKAGVLLNSGQGTFGFTGAYGSGSDSRSILLADFNRDGFKDIAYVNNGVGANGSVTVLFNKGNGTFGDAVWLYAGDLPDDVTAGDFNGDGNTDIAIANSYYSQVIMLFGSSDGSFSGGYSELGGVDSPTSIVSGDFNGDGRLDYAVTSWSTGQLSVFTNRDGYSFAGAGTFSVGQTPVAIAAGKLDGDSLPDLVAVNQGSVTVLFSAAGSPPPPPPPPPPAQITLTLSTRTTSKARLVDLKWSGVASSSVDAYRNGSRIATVPNSGSYTDQLQRRAAGTFKYKVCAAGSQQCSKEVSISF